MNLEEIKNKIEFLELPHPFDDRIRLVRARLKLKTFEAQYDPGRDHASISFLKKELTRNVLSEIYDDRQREFAELLESHALAHPLTPEFRDSRFKLIGLARRMMPRE